MAKLQTLRTHLLLTELGALDLLSEIGAGRTYQDLAGRAILYELGEDRVPTEGQRIHQIVSM